MPIQSATLISHYRIIKKVGQGGMAEIYQAEDTHLKRNVAIKIIRRGHFPPESMQRILKRFEREARALASLDHPHILKVLDYGRFEGLPYLVMPYLPGGTLRQRMGKAMPWKQAVQLLLPIAQALQHAHIRGIVHRDVKPTNILFSKAGEPLLADFGIAKLLSGEQTMELTTSSMGVGTPEYMSPEQAEGKTVDERTDIYALGTVLYELVTGHKPFSAETPMAVLVKHLHDPLPDPRKFASGLPGGLVAVLNKAMAKKPDGRFASMASFAVELEALSASKKPEQENVRESARSIRPVAAVKRQEKTILDKPSQLVGKKVFGWLGGVAAVLILAMVIIRLFLTGIPVTLATEVSATNQPPTLEPTLPKMSPAFLTPAPVLEIGSSRVSAKDGMIMMYVPAGESIMGSDKGDGDEKPVHTVHLDGYWVDKTEVSIAQYRLCVQEGFCEKPSGNYYDDGRFSDNPVVNVSWNDAKAYCAWAGRRLPSEAEWEKAARGPDGRTYPWGEVLHHSKANYDYLNGAIYPAYSKEEGIGFYGALNLSGNVWEWVADWYGESYYVKSPSRNPKGPETGTFRVYRGGSWISGQMDVRSSNRAKNYPTYRSDSVGFRCAMDAGTKVPTETAPNLSMAASPAPLISASPTLPVAQGSQSLGIGSSRVSEKDGMKLMYVSAGEFTMGSNNGADDEKPAHKIYLDAFWIDQTEVTNDQYRQCVQEGVCRAPGGKDYINTNYASHPVVYVDWNDAKAYCGWAGRRLPTEAEWEKAARGTEGRTYPWGEVIDCSKANYLGCKDFTTTSPAGYYLSGASLYVALDMAGNVGEWVADWFGGSYYSNSPASNPTGPATGNYRVYRGGSWNGNGWDLRVTDRRGVVAGVRYDNIGFRCAVGAGQDLNTVPTKNESKPEAGNTASASNQANDICRIAFRNDKDGNGEIYLINPDGSGATNLTNNAAFDGNPQWSPDGRQLIFTSNRDGNNEVYLMNSDGSGIKNLTNNLADDTNGVWSSEGRKLSFRSNRDGRYQMYTINLDGSNVQKIFEFPYDVSAPSWSPDGKKILFSTGREKNSDIFVMDLDGLNVRNLTNSASVDEGAAWSPDGTKNLFQSLRDGNLEVYVMQADGSKQTNLTRNPPVDGTASWSPDSTKIIYSSNSVIKVMDANGNNVRIVTGKSDFGWNPVWSPLC